MVNKNKYKISLIINIIIVTLVIISSIFMFIGFKFMPGKSLLNVSKLEMFKYFTVDSNILVGIASSILAIYEIKVLKNKITEIPRLVYILKLVSTVAISLTFITTLIFLSPQYGISAMYNNSNLFFHLVIPILAIISYINFEKYDSKSKEAIYGIIPMFLYSIYYATNIFLHLNNNSVTSKYDFYGFLQGNINNIYIVVPIMFLVTYLISVFLIFLNKKAK